MGWTSSAMICRSRTENSENTSSTATAPHDVAGDGGDAAEGMGTSTAAGASSAVAAARPSARRMDRLRCGYPAVAERAASPGDADVTCAHVLLRPA